MAKRLTLLTGAAAIALLAAGSARADTVYTVTSSGTIDQGTDGLGVFGTAGADLTGLSYSMVMTFSPDVLGEFLNADPYEEALITYNTSLSVTVNGQSYTASSNDVDLNAEGVVEIVDLLHQEGPDGADVCGNDVTCDGLASAVEGEDGAGNFFYALQELESGSTDDIIQSSSLAQDLSIDPTSADTTTYEFQLGDCYDQDGTCTGFSDQMDNITLNYTSVPEPATLSLFGAALAGLGAMRRRRRRAARV